MTVDGGPAGHLRRRARSFRSQDPAARDAAALWLAGAFFALIPVLDQKQTVQYVATSVYLVIAAIIFACLFCDGNLVRLLILRRAYVIAALIATAAGYVGLFPPGSRLRYFPRQ